MIALFDYFKGLQQLHIKLAHLSSFMTNVSLPSNNGPYFFIKTPVQSKINAIIWNKNKLHASKKLLVTHYKYFYHRLTYSKIANVKSKTLQDSKTNATFPQALDFLSLAKKIIVRVCHLTQHILMILLSLMHSSRMLVYPIRTVFCQTILLTICQCP